MDNQDERDLVRIRDANTRAHLIAAEEAIARALKSMPNHVDSAFDPVRDVHHLEDALRGVRVVSLNAEESEPGGRA